MFHDISRWCLENKDYIGRWRVSIQENGGMRRIIPIDLENSERRLEKRGFYVFKARIKPVSWMHEILHIDLAFLNLRVLSFGLRFLDHGDLSPVEDVECNPLSRKTDLIPVPPSPGSRSSSPSMLPCDGQCGKFIGFKVLPWTTTPAVRWRMSPTKPDQVMWKIELIPNEREWEHPKSVDQEIPFQYYWTKPKYFDTVRVSATLEAIRYEYILREEVERARREHPEDICVCDHLVFPAEHEQEFWSSESGYGYSGN